MKLDAANQLKSGFEEVRDFLIAVGDEKRQIIIIALLNDHACHGLRVVDLTDITKLSRPAVSHHLKLLKQAGLVDVRSEGTKNYYYLSNAETEIYKLRQLLDQVLFVMSKKRDEHEENSHRID